MSSFLLGFAVAIISYLMAYSYMSRSGKRLFNRWFANPVVDIALTSSIMLLSVGTSGSLFLALGIGFGLSLSLRTGKYLYGIG